MEKSYFYYGISGILFIFGLFSLLGESSTEILSLAFFGIVATILISYKKNLSIQKTIAISTIIIFSLILYVLATFPLPAFPLGYPYGLFFTLLGPIAVSIFIIISEQKKLNKHFVIAISIIIFSVFLSASTITLELLVFPHFVYFTIGIGIFLIFTKKKNKHILYSLGGSIIILASHGILYLLDEMFRHTFSSSDADLLILISGVLCIGFFLILMKKTHYEKIYYVIGVVAIFGTFWIIIVIKNGISLGTSFGYFIFTMSFLVISYWLILSKQRNFSNAALVAGSLTTFCIGVLVMLWIVSRTESFSGIFGSGTMSFFGQNVADTMEQIVLSFVFLPFIFLILIFTFLIFRHQVFRKSVRHAVYVIPRKLLEAAANPQIPKKRGIIAFTIVSILINFSVLYMAATISPFDLLGLVPGSDMVSQFTESFEESQKQDAVLIENPDLVLFFTVAGPVLLFILRQNRLRDLRHGIFKFRGIRVLLIFLYFTTFSIIMNEFVEEDQEVGDLAKYEFVISESLVSEFDKNTSLSFAENKTSVFAKNFTTVDSSNNTRSVFGRGETFFIAGNIGTSSVEKIAEINFGQSGRYYFNQTSIFSIPPSGEFFESVIIPSYWEPRTYVLGIYFPNYVAFQNIDVLNIPPMVPFESLVSTYFLTALPALGLTIIISSFLIEQFLILRIQNPPKIQNQKPKDEIEELKQKIEFLTKRLDNIENNDTS